MDKEKIQRVKKVLKCWQNSKNAYECPCDDIRYCQHYAARDAVILIEEQEREIARLKGARAGA